MFEKHRGLLSKQLITVEEIFRILAVFAWSKGIMIVE
jgi:hypothetical protein